MHEVEIPTSPTKAEQRLPLHRMPDRSAATSKLGMRSRSQSSSVVNRGQSGANEQHAPQVWQGDADADAGCLVDSDPISAALFTICAPCELRNGHHAPLFVR